jgi:glycosyltransferase involved in cell wall biosynthesis
MAGGLAALTRKLLKMAERIFLNDNIPSQATMRGVTRYFKHITDGLIAHFGCQITVFSVEQRQYTPATHIRSVRFKGSEQFCLHDLLSALVMRRLRPGLVFSPWCSNVFTSAPKIFTIYDFTYELFPQYRFRGRVPLRNLLQERKKCIEQAEVLLTISHSTARDILSAYPHLNPAKVVVTQLGVSPYFFDFPPKNELTTGRPYLLYIGTRGGYKNFLRLLLAYAQSGLAQEINLKVISSAPITFEETEIIRKYQLTSAVQFIPSADEAELRTAYANAVAFIYPSEYEGFGLPILEAMASGTLVATANAASMPEVGGEAAFYFDPYQVEDITESLKRVVNLPADQRAQRVAAGLQHAHTFTWERCQQQTIALFERLLN